ncbi:hypothetical protein SRIMM317S_00425 [Streptomyces rimosus subsp. rimosus]
MGDSTVLLVYARGGPPPSDAIPKAAAATDRLHLLLLDPLPLPAVAPAARCCASVTDLTADRPEPGELIDRIVALARRTAADAVLTFSEFALLAVAEAAERLGLRGPGPGAARARSKRLMRRTWADAGLPVPRFRYVDSLTDLEMGLGRTAPAHTAQVGVGRRVDRPDRTGAKGPTGRCLAPHARGADGGEGPQHERTQGR